MAKTVRLTYRDQHGNVIALALPAPVSPALLQLLEQTLARQGFVRVESCGDR